MRKIGLLIKKDETCKIIATNYITKEDKEIQILNGEIINNTEGFKLSGHKTKGNEYFLDAIIDNSGTFLGPTKKITLTSGCK